MSYFHQDLLHPINVNKQLTVDFLEEAYKDHGKLSNIYEFAAQKVLKYEKIQKEKKMKLSALQ